VSILSAGISQNNSARRFFIHKVRLKTPVKTGAFLPKSRR